MVAWEEEAQQPLAMAAQYKSIFKAFFGSINNKFELG